MWKTHLLRPDVIVQNHGSIKVTAFRSFLSCQMAGINEDFPVVDEWYGVGNEDDQQGEADDDNDDVVWCAEEEVVEKETKADNEDHGVTGRHQPRSSRCVHRQSCLINLLKTHIHSPLPYDNPDRLWAHESFQKPPGSLIWRGCNSYQPWVVVCDIEMPQIRNPCPWAVVKN